MLEASLCTSNNPKEFQLANRLSDAVELSIIPSILSSDNKAHSNNSKFNIHIVELTEINSILYKSNSTIATIYKGNSMMTTLLTSNAKCPSLPFEKQCLMSLSSFSSNQKGSSLLRGEIDGNFLFQRNSYGQIYSTHVFDNSEHLTVAIDDRTVLSSFRSPSKDLEIPFLYIPNKSNYVSSDHRVIVINKDSNVPAFEGQRKLTSPIKKCTSMVTKMFEAGLSEFFFYDTKKRSSGSDGNSRQASRDEAFSRPEKRKRAVNSKGGKILDYFKHSGKQPTEEVEADGENNGNVRSNKVSTKVSSKFERNTGKESTIDLDSLPTITLGYSMMDTNEYADSMSTIAGTVKPFIKDGNIPREASVTLVEMIEMVLSWLPEESTFNIGAGGSEQSIYFTRRLRMIKRLKKTLCGNGDCTNFRVEGITILIPLSIGIHIDDQNCDMSGMTNVISINTRVPKNKRTISEGKNSKLWKWLELNGYESYFPCSILLYSRKSVGNYCAKIQDASDMRRNCRLRWIIFWALSSKVDSNVDYRSKVWNSKVFKNRFTKHASKRNGSRFGGKMYVTVACYDKMVSSGGDELNIKTII